MQYAPLGRTGLKVSRLCLGTMNFGWQTDEPGSFAVMDEALETGINFFDTANVYGRRRGEGYTEQIIGRWLAQGGRRREQIVLATKVFGGMGDGPNDRGLSAYHIRRMCDDSLRRLQTDRLDLYQMHHVDRSCPWEEIWQAMEQLVSAGKVLYVGTSNFAAWHIVSGLESARGRHLVGLVSEQCLYNLAVRSIELEILPACRHYGVGIMPWSPLHGGMLGGVLEKTGDGRRASEQVQKRIAEHRPALEKYEAFCRELGSDPAVVGLAWLLAQPGVTAPIIGPRTLEQLTGAAAALDLKLDGAALKRLDEIWPGPGGPAPEAFAW